MHSLLQRLFFNMKMSEYKRAIKNLIRNFTENQKVKEKE